jgi:hypothetical protein
MLLQRSTLTCGRGARVSGSNKGSGGKKGKKGKGQVSFLGEAIKGQVSFLGLPLGRVVLSRPRRTALLFVH